MTFKKIHKTINQQLLTGFSCLALLLAPHAALAGSNDPHSLKISRPGDTEMSCKELVDEAKLMRDIIQTTENIKGDNKLKEHGVSAVGALGSLILGTATAGLGLAAAGFLVSQEVKNDAEDIDSVQDVAEQRRSFMVGIYNAKRCDGSIESAMIDIEKKSSMALASEKLAALEPAAGNNDQYGHNHSRMHLND